jgi:hemerythrin-like metal-binding protein
MGLTWAAHLSVGNGLIDSDHKNMIVIVNSMEQAIGTKNREALSKASELLEHYMDIHILNEKKIADAIELPFEKNASDHLQLMSELNYMMNVLEDMYRAWPADAGKMYSSFLGGWMTDHIIRTDMQMKLALQAYPYDFNPC